MAAGRTFSIGVSLSYRGSPVKVDLEPLTFCLRIFADDARPGFDTYLAAATGIFLSRTVVELKGVTAAGVPWVVLRRPLAKAFAEQGVKRVRWVRMKQDGQRIFELNTETLKVTRVLLPHEKGVTSRLSG